MAADERETTDLRALLNLGHTFGHALEAETGFGSDLLHGEAVGAGMAHGVRPVGAARPLPGRPMPMRVRRHLGAVGLPMRLRAIGGDNRRNWDAARLIEHMRGDKKAEAGKLTFILARGIGKAFVTREVDESGVARPARRRHRLPEAMEGDIQFHLPLWVAGPAVLLCLRWRPTCRRRRPRSPAPRGRACIGWPSRATSARPW